MKKTMTWLIILLVVLLLLIYVASFARAETRDMGDVYDALSARASWQQLEKARVMLVEGDDSLEHLVREGSNLLAKGIAWEPMARKQLRRASERARTIEEMIAPFLPPSGTSALRLVGIGIGDSIVVRVDTSAAFSRGEVVDGPRREREKILWKVVRTRDKEGAWFDEQSLRKIYPHHPALLAQACWLSGNVRSYKLLSALRIYNEDDVLGAKYGSVRTALADIIRDYECALAALSLPEALSMIGPEETTRAMEIIRKNIPILQEQKKQADGKGDDAQVGPGEEKAVMKAILGSETVKEGGQRRVVVPAPQKEGDPQRKYSPGIPVGVH